jgi:hypothetical protein
VFTAVQSESPFYCPKGGRRKGRVCGTRRKSTNGKFLCIKTVCEFAADSRRARDEFRSLLFPHLVFYGFFHLHRAVTFARGGGIPKRMRFSARRRQRAQRNSPRHHSAKFKALLLSSLLSHSARACEFPKVNYRAFTVDLFG